MIDNMLPDQPEDAALREKIMDVMRKGDSLKSLYGDQADVILQLIRKHKLEMVEAAYRRGYNTGWVAASRKHVSDLICENCLQVIDAELQATQPPAADTTKQGESDE